MKTNLNFSLTLDSKQKDEVFLQVEEYQQIEMILSSQSQPKNFIYEAKFAISHSCQFPRFLKYNYIVNGTNLYKAYQDLVISKKPLSTNIYVNDTKMPKDGTNKIVLTFYIYIPTANEHNLVFLVSDSPVFKDQDQSYFPLQQTKGSNIWAATTLISVFLNQPIIYKYVVCDSSGHEISKESGRPHVLFIHSPIAYKNVCVYDVWNNFTPFLSFYPHLVKPSEVQSHQSSVKIEFTPKTPAKNVYLQGLMFQNEELFPDSGRWRRDLQIPSLFEKFTFQIGTVENSNTGSIKWESEPIFKINRPYPNIKEDQYVSNLFFGDSFNDKLIGLYIPLVSIPSDPSKAVGNFASLVDLSKWCKQCEIDILSIHIEQIEGGLIDPIHSNIPIENERALFEQEPPQNRMGAIRNAKLAELWKNYQSWSRENDKEFELFAICNPKIREKCTDNEFSFYVQYTLFKDFYIAFAEIVDIGIQLILDLNATCDLKDQIEIYSRYTQGIRIVGLSQFIERLTIGHIKKIFNQASDSRMFNFFMDYFCRCDGSNQNNGSRSHVASDQQPVVLLKTCYSTSFIQSLEHIYKSIDPDFPNKLETIKEKFERSEMARILLDNLAKVVPDCPATIFLDSAASLDLGQSNVNSMKIIPCAQNLQNFVPNFLSPEKVSEFPDNADLYGEINRRIRSNSKIVIVYFLDFLKTMAEGGSGVNVQIKPMQLIKDHCRCSFGISVSNLMENQELNQKIQNVLYSAKQQK